MHRLKRLSHWGIKSPKQREMLWRNISSSGAISSTLPFHTGLHYSQLLSTSSTALTPAVDTLRIELPGLGPLFHLSTGTPDLEPVPLSALFLFGTIAVDTLRIEQAGHDIHF